MSVEADAGAVVAHRCALVGVTGGFLYVTERDAGVERGGDERVPERVGSDLLGDARTSGDTPHDTSRRMAIEPAAVVGLEDRSFATFTDGEVNSACSAGARVIVTILPPLRRIVTVR